MTVSRGLTIAVAACAALMVAGPADARHRSRTSCSAPAPVVTPPGMGSTSGAMGGAMGIAGGMARDPAVLQHFDEIDTDHNGQLSRAELTAWTEKVRQLVRQQIVDHIRAADTDGDGRISRIEADARLPMLADHFAFFDANGDGYITPDEFQRLQDPAVMRAMVQARLSAADLNHDGKLDIDEVTAAFPRLSLFFAAMDRDLDGYLTFADFDQMMFGSN